MSSSPVFVLICFLSSWASGAPVAAPNASATESPWALSLSGNGFLAMAHGAGVVKALSTAGYLDTLTTVSSVSGGSWLNTLLAFDSTFHDGLVSSQDIDDWFTDYQSGCSARGQEMQLTECMQENGPENCWADFVGAFLYRSEVASLAATAEQRLHRSGLSNSELLIASNIATQSLMSDQSTTTLLDVTEIELPVYYTIPAAKSSQQPSWSVPYGLGSFPTVQGPAGAQASFHLPTPVRVHEAGAVSSAANGAAGAPSIKAGSQPASDFCDFFPCPTQERGNMAESAICSDSMQGAHCAFPSVRLIDGCYSDNTGLALNIGHLQKKHPGNQLNIYVVNSNQCDRSKDPTCIQSIRESSFRNLFSDSPYPAIASEGWIDGGAGISVPTVDRVVFKESITDEQALGETVNHGWAVGNTDVTVMTGTFTTVENRAFGVSAGSTVRLVVFNANSAAPLQPASPDDMAQLSAVAQTTLSVAKTVLDDMQQPSKASPAHHGSGPRSSVQGLGAFYRWVRANV